MAAEAKQEGAWSQQMFAANEKFYLGLLEQARKQVDKSLFVWVAPSIRIPFFVINDTFYSNKQGLNAIEGTVTPSFYQQYFEQVPLSQETINYYLNDKLINAAQNKLENNETMLQIGNHIKSEGNKHFKNGMLDEATRHYKNGLKFVQTTVGDSKVDDLKAKLFNNLSLVAFKQQKYSQSLIYCSKALEIDPKYKKALYRKKQIEEIMKMEKK